jgi:hypothetical protein
MVTTYIKKLNSGSAPGIDGIMAEHLKYALNSRIVNHISVMLSICFKYGIVPVSFSQGLLVPLLKKPTLDPTLPQHYRPVTVSSTLSKILELYILDVSDCHEFSDLQFGFVAGRGTNMATALANDVISYCTKRGSPVYTCSLDAEGAFDAVPHAILFQKALKVIPDHCWLILVKRYRSI